MKKGEVTETGERSRRRILDATIELLGERGLTGTSMNEVCARAGIAKTGLYWHFDNKAGLLAAAIEDLRLMYCNCADAGANALASCLAYSCCSISMVRLARRCPSAARSALTPLPAGRRCWRTKPCCPR